MKRSKRFTIRRIALGLAVAAVVPATAQARPMEVSGNDLRTIHDAAVSDALYPGELPKVVVANSNDATVASSGPDEIPYLSHGVGVTEKSLGLTVGPDDRSFSRQSSGQPVVATSDGSGFDYGTGSLGGLVLILAAAGSALVVHHSRKGKLSPA